MQQDNLKEFDRIGHWVPDAILDLKYGTQDNFLGRAVYDVPYDQLRSGTLRKLKCAAERLRAMGYRLVIWDAFRPLAVQKLLWEIVKDPDFVAPPDRGSHHNRGCAVDVTLADPQGKRLAMPTAFDDFSGAASASLDGLEDPVRAHLQDLQAAMVSAGFEIYINEWWHFTDTDWEIYELV